MQLRNASLSDLCARYRRLAQLGIVPHRAMNHGPSISFYFRDPDQNIVELSASNFATGEEMLACLASKSYLRNPAGHAIDPAEFVAIQGAAI